MVSNPVKFLFKNHKSLNIYYLKLEKAGKWYFMKNVITKDDLEKNVEEALLIGLDYIAEKRQYSVWTEEKKGWQEKWERAQYSGLYATTNALRLLAMRHERYKDIINDSVSELEYMFGECADYEEMPGDNDHSRRRKERCRFLLKQNENTTLKAVYYLRTYDILRQLDLLGQDAEKIDEGAGKAQNQIIEAYDSSTGYFLPAKDNTTDRSVLTTMQAYAVMTNRQDSFDDHLSHAKELFISFLEEYEAAKNNNFKDIDKFQRYELKRNVIAAVYALAHTVNDLNKDEASLLQNVVFDTMSDTEIRNGFMITDSYSVPGSTTSYDDYSTDSKVIYIESLLQLIKYDHLPAVMLESFWDDYIEIIDTVKAEKKYVSWDMSLSFSHNVKGLLILCSLIEVLKKCSMTAPIIKINPTAIANGPRYVDSRSIVLFMGFGKDHSQSFYKSVEEILEKLGFEVWCASNEPYDRLVMDNIWNRLDKAQAVIIDCTGRSANVMYEAGLSHGFGKLVLLCGEKEEVFPYEKRTYFKTCIYNPDGDVNPPPYRDLQEGIVKFVRDHIDEFCMLTDMKTEVLEKADCFTAEYLSGRS